MLRYVLPIIILCSFVRPVLAQQDEKISIGVGLSFSPFAVAGDDQNKFGTAGMTNFFIPFQFGPYIRFEPEVGLMLQSNQEQVVDSTVPGGSYERYNDHQIVRTGFGIFYTRRTDKDFEFGLGARIGIMSSEYETHSDKASIQDTDTHYAIFYLGGALSVEYYFSPHFSIGGELQLMHYSYGSPLQTIGSDQLGGYANPTKEQGVYATNEILSARFWF